MAGQEMSGEVLREVELKIDIRSASILVVPKSDEVNDANMPRNLHNAAELFLRAGMIDAAENVKKNASELLELYASDPDGKRNVKVGRGCVCWACGYCGLPKDGESKKGNSITDDLYKIPPGPCSKCAEEEQVNWLKVTKPGTHDNKGKKEELPWIEAPPLSEDEIKKKNVALLAAKRKEVENKVKLALLERTPE
mmetsp:Transcript_22516/g.48769  ORF Transcript_22516/g.48769 Transcript_22516/m.48769 type:complete len:195 (+) Transcript_22516:108-692(+)|eukprot:CAMPEP_0172317712 /NCGR_PEP_ID=MMETSP1058-20130122/32522_1 /TAXON_ID=83371 /ORGANISM="Detonula confervacea, Strain CCMP 353" /LENGTH=194 /DNA_ID=CAMNT_0013032335 /DNA_START=46 /DNA_END=630 /DNA_ORIENTATION=-